MAGEDILRKIKVIGKIAQPVTTYIKHAGTVDFNLLFWSAGTFYIQALCASIKKILPTRHMRVLLVKIFILVSLSCLGQVGRIAGRVAMTDKVSSPSYLTLILKMDSVDVTGTVPDSDGNFTIDKINNGTYSLVIRQIGYRDAITDGLIIVGDTLLNLNLVYPPPCTFTTSTNPKCIDGHTDKIIPIVYGLPNKRTMEKAKKGKLHLAGCNLTGCDPQYYCTLHKKEL